MALNIPDLINGSLEFIGATLNFSNVQKLYKDKKVQGVRWQPTAFFMGWGFWNLYYYPNLDQWASFFGGLLMVAANLVWTILALYYLNKKQKETFFNDN